MRASGREPFMQRFYEPRVLDLVCDEPSHERQFLATLRSHKGPGPYELWSIDGPHVETQALSGDPGVSVEMLIMLDKLAVRHRIRCPDCGLCVVAGDRLGSQGGWRSVSDLEPRPRGENRLATVAKTNSDLSKLADAGVARLSLSALGRILSM